MIRFWIFSSRLVLVGAILFALSAPLTLLIAWWMMSSLPVAAKLTFDNFQPVFTRGLAIGAGAGFLLSIGASMWDFLRNSARNRNAHAAKSRLWLNLWWCAIYTSPFYFTHSVLWAFYVNFSMAQIRRSGAASAQQWTTINSCFEFASHLILFLALWWAAARTITQTDVLTPRVLGAKLKRSASLST